MVIGGIGNRPIPMQRFSGRAPVAGAEVSPAGSSEPFGALPPVPRPWLPAAVSLRFGGQIDEDYHLELRSTEPINPGTTSALLQGLLIRNAIKKAKNDPSSLKLFVDAVYSDWFSGTSRAALADVFALLDRPVDVIVKEGLNDLGMLALQSASGKRLMYDGAVLTLGPVESGAPYMRNDDHAVRREFNNEYIRDLEHRIMRRAGIRSRADLYWKDLNGAEEFNALQALAKGRHGLVDGVIVKYDRVVTRADLDAYLAGRNWNEKQIRDFLANHLNIRKIPSRPLAEFSPGSVPPKTPKEGFPKPGGYQSLREVAETLEKRDRKEEREMNEDLADVVLSRLDGVRLPAPGKLKSDDDSLTFYKKDEDGVDEIPAGRIPLGLQVKDAELKARRIAMSFLSEPRGILEDDLIYFNDAFVDETADQVTRAIRELDGKKRRERSHSNIKLLVNSPGGSIASGLDIRSTIAHSKTKVDVIVTGMAASCGAFLVSSATGNRLMTPNARLMIHDAWWSRPSEPSKFYNQNIDALDRMTKAFVDAIAQASGRPFKEVWQDMKIDVWLNPLEAMFYGRKGLCDAILVGNDRVITRKDVMDYLKETLGSERAARRYLRDRIASLRVGRHEWRPEDHNEQDPFDNPLRTIETVAARAARDIRQVPQLAGSVTRPVKDVDQRVVVMPTGADDDEHDDRLSPHSRQVLQYVREKIMGRPAPGAR